MFSLVRTHNKLKIAVFVASDQNQRNPAKRRPDTSVETLAWSVETLAWSVETLAWSVETLAPVGGNPGPVGGNPGPVGGNPGLVSGNLGLVSGNVGLVPQPQAPPEKCRIRKNVFQNEKKR